MRKEHLGILCCIVLLTFSALGVMAVSGTVKVMPLGDSITKGGVSTAEEAKHPTYRYWLWNDLAENGYDVDFVGSWRMPNFTRFSFDQDNEGHGGYSSDEILHGVEDDRWEPGSLATWIRGYDYDVVLLLIGMNDVLRGVPTNESSTNIEKIITVLRQKNPAVTVFIGTLPPTSYYRQSLIDLNQEILRIADRTSRAGSPVIVVDHYYGYNGKEDNQAPDFVHPNESGEKKIAKNWYSALSRYLGDTPPTSTATTVPVTTTPAEPSIISTIAVIPPSGATYAQAREFYDAGSVAWSRAWGASDPVLIRKDLEQARIEYTNALNWAGAVNDPPNTANLALIRTISTAYIDLADAAVTMYDGANVYSMGRVQMNDGDYRKAVGSLEASSIIFSNSQVLFNRATTTLQSASFAGTEFGDGTAYTAGIVPVLNKKASYMGEFSTYATGWHRVSLAYLARSMGDETGFKNEAIQAMNLFAGLQSSDAFGADAVSNYYVLAGLIA
ncbi:MAG: hypothetical protein GXY82_06410 [Methanospirillum sp.]|nr:hypothetical protein [Methanospirillum sp.]